MVSILQFGILIVHSGGPKKFMAIARSDRFGIVFYFQHTHLCLGSPQHAASRARRCLGFN